MSYILHLETATKVCSVALSKDGRLIALKEAKEDGYSHGEKLTLFIQDVLQQGNIVSKELEAVSVTSGPGSYTGLRIGAATAKGLCYALNIPLIAIDSLTSMAIMAREKHPGINLCPVIDARRMEVYNLFIDSDFQRLKGITADVIDEQSYAEYEPFVSFGDGAEKLEKIWKGRSIEFDYDIESSAKGQVELAFDAFQKKSFEDVAYWEPFYLKDFVVGKKS